MKTLETWSLRPQAVLVKFVTGDGGVGKSRLAAEFAKTLQERKWSAGFVDLHNPTSFLLEKQGTLLVIDYPEENRDRVEELLRDLAMVPPLSKFRVLFLTRQRIDAWYEVIHDSNAADLVDMVPINLGRLDGSAEYKLYCSALECVAENLNTIPPPLSQEALTYWISQAPENDRALFILAAAVHSAIHPEDEVVRYNGREVIDVLVRREIDRLRRIAKSRGFKDPLIFARFLAIATVAYEISVRDILQIIEKQILKWGLKSDVDFEAELNAAGLLSEGVVRAPHPDILTAAFAVTVLSCNFETAPELVWSSLELDPKGGLNRIARICYDTEIVLGMHEHRIARWLAEAVSEYRERCELLEPYFREFHLPLGWIDAAIVIYRTLLEGTNNDQKRAYLLNNLAMHLSEAGERTDALKAIRKSVNIKRRLATANPASFEHVLAIGLTNLSNALSEVGDNVAALQTIQEAVDIRRRLATANPTRYEPDLALSLNTLSNALSEVGNDAAAMQVSLEAVKVYRNLAATNPIRYELDLALSLNNLSNRMSNVGDNIAALQTIQEAVDIRRRLATANPTRYEPDLASSLNNLSNELSRMGNNASALNVIREAVEIYRHQAAANPARYKPELASSLNNLSIRMRGVGDNIAALRAIQEAVNIDRHLAAADPTRYEPELASSLSNMAITLSVVGDNATAMNAIQEATDINRRLSETHPTRFEPTLARNMGAFGTILLKAGQYLKAAEKFREGADLIRPYAENLPNSHYEHLLLILEKDYRRAKNQGS